MVKNKETRKFATANLKYINFMATVVADKSINWQVASVNDSEISVEDYQTMVGKAENSGYMSYETHRRKFNEWFNEISKERTVQNA